jgi:hypothetical protein
MDFSKLGAVFFVFPGVDLVCAGAAAAVSIDDEIKNPITSAETIEVTNTVVLICNRFYYFCNRQM